MSNTLVIATVTETLSRTIQAAIGVDVPGATVTTVRPDSAAPDPGVNIFLYQATPNTAWRNSDLPTRNSLGSLTKRPGTALDLHYLLSFYGNEAEQEPQRLLASTIRTLHSHPLLTREMIRNTINANTFLEGSNLAEAEETVKFSQITLNLEELSKLWSVFFQSSYVLSSAYLASVVLISGEQSTVVAQPVIVPLIQLSPSFSLPGITPASPDDVDDLQLWLDAGSGVTHNNRGLVSHWSDKSGNGNHAFQNAEARQPGFVRDEINGKSVMRFDGVNNYFAIDQLHYDTQGQISGMTVVALVRSSNDNNQIIISFDGGAYWRLALRTGASGVIGWLTSSATGAINDLSTTESYTTGEWHIVSTQFRAGMSSDKRIFVDGEEVRSADAHGGENIGAGITRFGFIGVGSQADTVDGATGPNEFLHGDLAELLIFHRALPDAQRLQIEKYIFDKYSK